MDTNPYQPPESDIQVYPKDIDAEAIRKSHIKHEAAIRSLGKLYLIAGPIYVLLAVIALRGNERNSYNPSSATVNWGIYFLVLGAAQVWIGFGLRKLKHWSRIATAVLAGIGLMSFPIGTIFNSYFMYLVLCKKGGTVLSDDYRQIITQTPHVKTKIPAFVYILIGVLIAFILRELAKGL